MKHSTPATHDANTHHEFTAGLSCLPHPASLVLAERCLSIFYPYSNGGLSNDAT